MTYSWIILLVLMVASNFVIGFFGSYLAVFVVNGAILAAGYYLFRRDPMIDLRSSMLFLAGLTVINVLSDLNIMSSSMANLACIVLLIWSMAGGGRK